MIFGGIQKTSTIDFPGVLSCVVFVRGCDMNCFYCHNREIIAGSAGEFLPETEILAFLEKRRGLLDGVVVSGGEPTLQPDLAGFLQKLRAMSYRIKLDTNGQRPELTESLWREGLLDYVAMDVKALPRDYVSVCGADGFAKVKETIDRLSALEAKFEVRTTLYPGMTMEELEELLQALPPMPLWRLNYYHMPEVFQPQDKLRLRLKALSSIAVQENLPRLTQWQPRLVWQ